MSEQQHPPVPDIEDGEGHLHADVRGVFLYPDVGVRVHAQAEEDGSYRTSVLSIGWSMSRLDIFAKRDQVERLHRLLGEHLEQLDEYETALYAMRLERDGIAADVPDDVKRAALDAAAAEPRYIVEQDGQAFYVTDTRPEEMPGEKTIVLSSTSEENALHAADQLNAGVSLADLEDVAGAGEGER